MPSTKAQSQAQLLAEKLDRQGSIHVIQAFLDGVNISYTTFKYFFDALNPDTTISSSDTMHSWMLTPEGIAAAALESVFLIAFSMLANYLKTTDDYELCLMKPEIRIKKNKLYIQITEDGMIRYTVKTPSGIDLSSVITFEELGLDPQVTKNLTLNKIQQHLSKILEITLKRGHTKKPQPHLFNKYIIQIWPYFRDSLKGLKNSYKGINSLLMAFNLLGVLGVHDLNLLIVPVAVALGGLTILNRIWYRRMKNQRKEKQDENSRLHKEILACKTMTEEDAANFRLRIQPAQNQKERAKGFGSAVLAGFTDGLYMYMGVFTVAASLTGPFFIAVCALSAVYVLTSVVTRIYEEYDYQNKLKASQIKVELALAIHLLKTQLQKLDELLEKSDSSVEEEDKLRANIAKNWEQLAQSRKDLKSLSTILNTSALLGGLKNGLTAYGVLASILFAVGAILLLSSVAFPPALLVTVVFLGMACLIGFTIHSLVASYRYRREQRELCKSADDLLESTKKKVELLQVMSKEELERSKQRQLVKSILETVDDNDKRLLVKSSPQYSFETWLGKCLEIARAFFTGVKQAVKSENFTIGAFCQDTLVTIIATAVGGLISAISGALRALAKGFGHNDNDVYDHSAPVRSLPPLSSSTSTELSSASSALDGQHDGLISPVESENQLKLEESLPRPLINPRGRRHSSFFNFHNDSTTEIVPVIKSPRAASSLSVLSIFKPVAVADSVVLEPPSLTLVT